MLFSVDYLITYKIVLDNILKTSVVSEQTELDDVIAELFPLHCLVAIDIDLLEEIDEGQGEFHLQLLVGAVVVEMLKHD